MKALIACGDIGGLAAALCLHEIGAKVRVFEFPMVDRDPLEPRPLMTFSFDGGARSH